MNVILILADDLGVGDIGHYNGGITYTPALDRLFQDGCRFSQCYAGSPVCAPSRAALFTGRYPHRTGSIDTLEWRGLERIALSEMTIADLFRANGYRTGLVGKWHSGAFDMRYHPSRRGFEETLSFSGGHEDYWNWRLDRNGTRVAPDGRYLTDVFTDEARAFVARHRDERFFLHLSYNAPHYPIQAPEDAIARYRDALPENPALATLYAMISRMDEGIEALRSDLEHYGIARNTIIVFLSDNGPQFANGSPSGGASGSLERFNCGLRGEKTHVYEGGIRVPGVIHAPARSLPQESSAMLHSVDILPTLAEMCNVPTADLTAALVLDGRSIVGRTTDLEMPRFWQWNRYTPVPSSNAAMREGRWKLVLPPIPGTLDVYDEELYARVVEDPDWFWRHGIVDEPIDSVYDRFADLASRPSDSPMLFDLDVDETETHNVANEHPEITRRMSRALYDWGVRMRTEYLLTTT